MLQRIQTVFLALAAITNLGVYFTPIYTRAMEDPQQWIGFGLAISLVVAAIFSVYSIFLFNNRKNQINWVKRAAFVQIISLGFSVGVFFSLGGIGTYLWDEAIGTGLIVLGFIFQLLALRFINKDEKLVRSMDRIR
ncbi:MAG: DUF4293 domain-containing protein [Balneolaceae bacterium]|nr:DUF4293 domain-containing protein [Balneolaceae bacterium]MBO6545282.1 DUF4293 domain-containing protein [Balneolaceae bacterium]MBO6646678.1 DUF4293 domain-containing protein [Balneolaceae bacterium]